jgi:hypothetical protein
MLRAKPACVPEFRPPRRGSLCQGRYAGHPVESPMTLSPRRAVPASAGTGGTLLRALGLIRKDSPPG